MDVFINSMGMCRIGKKKGGFEEILCETVNEIDIPKKIDAIYVGSQNPWGFSSIDNLSARIPQYLGKSGVKCIRIENSSASGSTAFHQAFIAIKSGLYDSVLALGIEKMSSRKRNDVISLLSQVLEENERKMGLTPMSIAAMVCRLYMRKYGLKDDELAYIPVKSHENGSLNPKAQFQKRITIEDVLNSRTVAEPLRLLHCSPISDGCAMAVLSKMGDVKVMGIGHGTDLLTIRYRKKILSFRATKIAASEAYSMAKISPNDIDICEVHDAFSIMEIISLEDLRIFEEGSAGKMSAKGETSLNGKIPVNTSGGLKARGHPVGATGLCQIYEIFLQLTGNAEKRQVDGVKIGLTHNMGGFACSNTVTVLGK